MGAQVGEPLLGLLGGGAGVLAVDVDERGSHSGSDGVCVVAHKDRGAVVEHVPHLVVAGEQLVLDVATLVPGPP